MQGINTFSDIGLIASDFFPWVEKIVLGEHRAKPVVRAVTDHTQRVVFHQLRYIAHIAFGQLLPSGMNGCLFTYRAFKFEHNQWQSVDIQNAVWDALFLTLDFQLINQPELIVIRVAVVDQPDMQVFLTAILSFQVKAIADTVENDFVGLVQIGGRQGAQIADDAVDLAVGEIVGLVAGGEVLSKIISQENDVGFTGNVSTGCIGVALLAQQLDDGLFEFGLGVFHYTITVVLL